MSDPRLCSIHLEALPRREDFRRARELLLGACGQQTMAVGPAEDVVARSGKPPAAGGPVGTAQFWLVDGEGTYPLKVGVNTIGRMPDNDVSVLDGSVSRRHCAIVVHVTRGCEIYDTASKNGTFLNGQRVGAVLPLSPGDKIRLCERQFVLVSGDPHATAARKLNDDSPNDRTQVE